MENTFDKLRDVNSLLSQLIEHYTMEGNYNAAMNLIKASELTIAVLKEEKEIHSQTIK